MKISTNHTPRWMDGPSLAILPHMGSTECRQLAAAGYTALPQLLHALRGSSSTTTNSSSSSSSSSSTTNTNSSSNERRRAMQALERAVGGAAAAREVVAVCDRLPVCTVAWRAPRPLPRTQQQQQQQQDADDASASDPPPEEQLLLEVELVRHGGGGGGGSSGRGGGGGGSSGGGGRGSAPRVYAPRFPKVKEEGWWLVLGFKGSGELLALRRVSFGGRTAVRLAFPKHTAGGWVGAVGGLEGWRSLGTW